MMEYIEAIIRFISVTITFTLIAKIYFATRGGSRGWKYLLYSMIFFYMDVFRRIVQVFYFNFNFLGIIEVISGLCSFIFIVLGFRELVKDFLKLKQ